MHSALPSGLAAPAEALAAAGAGLRPRLVFASAACLAARGLNVPENSLLTLGTVVELLHTASLIHDDIIDNAENRRGRPSLHASFGTTQAVLTGNLLYTAAFARTFHCLGTASTEAIIQTAADMLAGELLQLQNAGKALSAEDYRAIVAKKTGSLMALACGESARLAGADPATVSLFRDIGESIGLLYQMQDDAADEDSLLAEGLDRSELIHRERDRLLSLLQPASAPASSDFSPLLFLIECIFH